MALAWVGSTFAQVSEHKRGAASSASKKKSNYAKNLTSGSITCANGYIAGSTMNLNLSVTFASPDAEYMDGLTITFPSGIVPNETGTSNPLTTNVDAGASGNINLISPVSGQSVSWGTIVAPFTQYGAVVPGTNTFVVNVTVAPGTTGTQTVNFTIFGDNYGAVPHSVTGTFTIDAAASNDLACASVSMPAAPITNVGTVVLSAVINNVGASSIPAGQLVTFTDGATVLGTSPTTGAIAAGGTETVTYNWTATAGIHTINAALPSDDNLTNNVATLTTCIYPAGYWGEGFEGITAIPPTDWTSDAAWALGTNPIFAYEGTQYAYTATATGADKRLVTPQLEVTNTDFITFHALTGATAAPYPELKLQYSTDKVTWTDLTPTATINGSAHILYLVNIPVTGQYYFAFNSNNTSSSSLRMDWPVMPPKAIPACMSPTNLSAGTITLTTAVLDWTNGATETAWNIQYGTSGFALGSGTIVPVTAHPYTLTGLTAGTSYEYYVQADCGGVGTSSWTGPFAFNTACDVVTTFPWVDGFESGIACYSITGLPGVETWALGTASPNGGTNDVEIDYDPVPAPQDQWIKSPVFNFSSLSAPQITFFWNMSYYWGVTPNDNYNMFLKGTTDGTTWTTLWTEPATFTDWTYYDTTISLAAYAAASYFQFAFEYVGTDGAAFYLDDITIDNITSINESEFAKSVSVYPNPTFGAIKVSRVNNATIEVYDIVGNKVAEKANTNTIDISNLTNGTYLIKVITNNQVINKKINLIK